MQTTGTPTAPAKDRRTGTSLENARLIVALMLSAAAGIYNVF